MRGFTLLELLLYIAIAGSILVVTSAFLALLLESRVKNETIAEVNQQGVQVLQEITQTLRNAESVTAPSAGTSASSLTVDVVASGDDPTVFALSSGAITITEGAGSAIPLTNSRVNASSLSFENLARSGTSDVVHISFTLSHINPEGRQAYSFTKTFYGSAAVRTP